MKPRLTFSDPDAERVALLQEGFRGHAKLTALAVSSNELMRLQGVDAIFLTILAAERWGARPISHKAQVFRATSVDRDLGWPGYIVAGVAANVDDPRDPGFELRMIILAVLEAVTQYNEAWGDPIQNVGFGPEWTGIRNLPPPQAASVIRDAYDESVAYR